MLLKSKIILWISWWPDSMFLYNFLKEKYWKNNLIIAHFNHKFRKESDIEEIKLKEFFEKEKVSFVSERYNWNNFKENILRKARYDFFQKIWWGKYFLALWHNLTDRIETTFLNIARWTWIKWFLNMKKIDNKRKIYRPLLDLTKKEIQKKCDELNIPYFIDQTNFDNTISKRNLLRNIILEKIEENFSESFFYNFNKVYKQIENILPQFNIEEYLEKIEENKYLLHLPENNLEYFIRELLEYFDFYDFRSAVIPEIIDYIQNAKWWGFKRYWNIFLKKKSNKVFIEIINIWQKKYKN